MRDFGPEFRYLDLGARRVARRRCGALNRGIAASRGRNLALMIDGAHVLTPGVLRFGLQGLATYAPAIVATQQWYVGPGQQGDAMDNGYDQAYEDRLFERIQWPSNGYRLFEIGHFVGDRDWLDGVWESNCMFVSRAQLEQVGGFDERFSMAGGGYANLELYERLGSSPDVTVCTIIGEGSFHQVHGGTTTNQADAEERRARVFGYGQHYAELRGRAFRGPGKPIHFVGRITTGAARRTKPRRLSTRVFADAAEAIDGRPERPTPVPDDLRWAFTEAVWRNLPWRHTTWLGEPIHTAPTDLLAYQEILSRVRPDWVVEIGASDAGRAGFLASICELIGHGQVLSLRSPEAPDPAPHPRLRVLHRATARPRHRRAGPRARRRRQRRRGARRLRRPGHDRPAVRGLRRLVGVGSYVVVTDTIVNGHPVWPSFGPGPSRRSSRSSTATASSCPTPTWRSTPSPSTPGLPAPGAVSAPPVSLALPLAGLHDRSGAPRQRALGRPDAGRVRERLQVTVAARGQVVVVSSERAKSAVDLGNIEGVGIHCLLAPHDLRPAVRHQDLLERLRRVCRRQDELEQQHAQRCVDPPATRGPGSSSCSRSVGSAAISACNAASISCSHDQSSIT